MLILRVRGTQGVRRDVRDTLAQFKLTRKNHCVLVEEKPHLKGMLVLARDYVTWGEPSEETLAALAKKGKPPYRLHPPVKGFGGSIKSHYPEGALGYRGEKINELIKAML